MAGVDFLCGDGPCGFQSIAVIMHKSEYLSSPAEAIFRFFLAARPWPMPQVEWQQGVPSLEKIFRGDRNSAASRLPAPDQQLSRDVTVRRCSRPRPSPAPAERRVIALFEPPQGELGSGKTVQRHARNRTAAGSRCREARGPGMRAVGRGRGSRCQEKPSHFPSFV